VLAEVAGGGRNRGRLLVAHPEPDTAVG
jgi:hypothetical protein